MFVKFAGRTTYRWRAVDSEGEVLDMVQSRRDKRAAVRLLRRLLKKQGMAPEALVTDRLRAYDAAARELGVSAADFQGKRMNDRAECSHVPIRRRERKMQGFRSPGSAQRFPTIHAAVANTFTTCRHLVSTHTHRQFRCEAFAAWREAVELAV
jgi:putative transposase